MNRRERRHMQKQLGLNKHYKKETREQKFERWRGNIEEGKRMQQEFANQVEVSIQEQKDQKMSDIISGLAEDIAKREKIPVIDAMVKAQEQYEKSRK
jgi:hypothetical protein